MGRKSKSKVSPAKPRGTPLKAEMRAHVRSKATRQRERRKIRKKVSESTESLLAKAEELISMFQYEQAVLCCEKALRRDGDNLALLEMAGPLFLEVGLTDPAVELLQHAVVLSPDAGHTKYLYLGQLSSGEEAVHHFTTAIDIMTRELKQASVDSTACEPSLGNCEAAGGVAAGGVADVGEGVTEEDLCSAYCSLAEVYLTDQCFAVDAEQRCHDNCLKALEHGPKNAEAHQLMASCLLSQGKEEDARRTLLEGLSFWLHSNSAEEGSAAQPASTPAPSSPGPSYLSRLSCSRLLLELGEYEPARAVLEALLKEDDEVVEAWYLMGWLSHLTHDHASTRFYLEQTEKLFGLVGCELTEVLEHTRELLEQLPSEEAEEEEEEKGEEEEEEEEEKGEEEEEEEEENIDCMDVS